MFYNWTVLQSSFRFVKCLFIRSLLTSRGLLSNTFLPVDFTSLMIDFIICEYWPYLSLMANPLVYFEPYPFIFKDSQ
jgi:hypothetical protein